MVAMVAPSLLAVRPGADPPGRPDSTAAGGRNLANNVLDYRFVKDRPAKTGVKSSQSGNPSRCFGS
jgi:hypothetical protein